MDGNTQSDKMSDDCSRVDIRLPSSPLCSDFSNDDITLSYLYPPGLSTDLEAQLDAMISSNAVPMYDTFKTGMQTLVRNLMQNHWTIVSSCSLLCFFSRNLAASTFPC